MLFGSRLQFECDIGQEACGGTSWDSSEDALLEKKQICKRRDRRRGSSVLIRTSSCFFSISLFFRRFSRACPHIVWCTIHGVNFLHSVVLSCHFTVAMIIIAFFAAPMEFAHFCVDEVVVVVHLGSLVLGLRWRVSESSHCSRAVFSKLWLGIAYIKVILGSFCVKFKNFGYSYWSQGIDSINIAAVAAWLLIDSSVGHYS